MIVIFRKVETGNTAMRMIRDALTIADLMQ